MSVLTTRRTSTGTLVSNKARAFGMWVLGGATNGTVELKDGGASGLSKIIIDVPGITTSGTTFASYVPFPEGGISFNTDCHATLTTAAGVTLMYENRNAA